MRIRKGKYSGIPATIIAQMMGCSVPTARRWLKKMSIQSLQDIGHLIYEYQVSRRERSLATFLNTLGKQKQRGRKRANTPNIHPAGKPRLGS